jgi:hypothetical protein
MHVELLHAVLQLLTCVLDWGILVYGFGQHACLHDIDMQAPGLIVLPLPKVAATACPGCWVALGARHVGCLTLDDIKPALSSFTGVLIVSYGICGVQEFYKHLAAGLQVQCKAFMVGRCPRHFGM